MEPAQYEAWLAGGGAQGSLAQRGEALFQQLGCSNCHLSNGTGRCPNLVGVFGKPQRTNAGVVVADPAYIRESILNPGAKLVEGYENIMPTFQGLVSEDSIQQLIEYVKSLGTGPAANGGGAQPGTATGGSARAVPGAPAPGTGPSAVRPNGPPPPSGSRRPGVVPPPQ
jgi:cytochrome c oxidase subunit 2